MTLFFPSNGIPLEITVATTTESVVVGFFPIVESRSCLLYVYVLPAFGMTIELPAGVDGCDEELQPKKAAPLVSNKLTTKYLGIEQRIFIQNKQKQKTNANSPT